MYNSTSIMTTTLEKAQQSSPAPQIVMSKAHDLSKRRGRASFPFPFFYATAHGASNRLFQGSARPAHARRSKY
jgi:hypothetical protein